MPAPARMICPPGLQSVRPDHEAAGQEPSLIKRAHKGCTVQMHEHASSKHSVLQSWSAARLLLTWGLSQNSSRHMMTKDPSISSRRDKKACKAQQQHHSGQRKVRHERDEAHDE
jgi:hypothetical protein